MSKRINVIENKELKKLTKKQICSISLVLVLSLGVFIILLNKSGNFFLNKADEQTLFCKKTTNLGFYKEINEIEMKFKNDKVYYTKYIKSIGNPTQIFKSNWGTVVDAVEDGLDEVETEGYKVTLTNDARNYKYTAVKEIDYSIIEASTIAKYNLDDIASMSEDKLTYDYLKKLYEDGGYTCGVDSVILEDNKDSANTNKKYYQTYTLVNLQNRNRKSTITFGANNKCLVDFSELNNKSSGSRDYMSVTYNAGDCTYYTDDDVNFTIDYNGTLEIAYYYYHDYYKKLQKQVLNTGYTMKNAKIRFNEDYSKFEFTNGKWNGQTGEIFYYYFKEDGTETSEENNSNNMTDNQNDSSSTVNNNSSNNSSYNNDYSSDNNSDNGNPSVEELSKLSKENLEKTTVSLTHEYSNSYSVNIKHPTMKGFKISIDGESYSAQSYISLEYKENGKNCIDIKLTDEYDNTKTINECIDFSAKAPDYEAWIYNLAPSGECTMMLKNLSLSKDYYNAEDLSCSVDGGNKFDCGNQSSFYVKLGTYSLVITNKYGLSQTVPVDCKIG